MVDSVLLGLCSGSSPASHTGAGIDVIASEMKETVRTLHVIHPVRTFGLLARFRRIGWAVTCARTVLEGVIALSTGRLTADEAIFGSKICWSGRS